MKFKRGLWALVTLTSLGITKNVLAMGSQPAPTSDPNVLYSVTIAPSSATSRELCSPNNFPSIVMNPVTGGSPNSFVVEARFTKDMEVLAPAIVSNCSFVLKLKAQTTPVEFKLTSVTSRAFVSNIYNPQDRTLVYSSGSYTGSDKNVRVENEVTVVSPDNVAPSSKSNYLQYYTGLNNYAFFNEAWGQWLQSDGSHFFTMLTPAQTQARDGWSVCQKNSVNYEYNVNISSSLRLKHAIDTGFSPTDTSPEAMAAYEALSFNVEDLDGTPTKKGRAGYFRTDANGNVSYGQISLFFDTRPCQ